MAVPFRLPTTNCQNLTPVDCIPFRTFGTRVNRNVLNGVQRLNSRRFELTDPVMNGVKRLNAFRLTVAHAY
jgi:hypothetical protein